MIFCAIWIRSVPFKPISLIFILILFSHICQGLPRFFLLVSPSRFCINFSSPSKMIHASPIVFFFCDQNNNRSSCCYSSSSRSSSNNNNNNNNNRQQQTTGYNVFKLYSVYWKECWFVRSSFHDISTSTRLCVKETSYKILNIRSECVNACGVKVSNSKIQMQNETQLLSSYKTSMSHI